MVDIIMPAHNPGSYIVEAINSCLNQSYKDVLITVVDDASTQDLSFIKKKYPKVNLIRSDVNLGPAGARNLGIKKTSRDFISFLDADDQANQDKILYSLEAFKSIPNRPKLVNNRPIPQNREYLLNGPIDKSIGMVCGNYQRILTNGKLTSPFYKTAPEINWKTMMKNNLVSTGSVMIRRDVIEKVGMFDERFWIAEDYSCWVRVVEEYRIKYIHKVLYLYRQLPSGGSLTQRTDIQKDHIKNLEIIKKESEERMKKKNAEST